MIDRRYLNNILDELNDYALQREWYDNSSKTMIRPFSIWTSENPIILTFHRDVCAKYMDTFQKKSYKTESSLIKALDSVDIYEELDNFILEHIRVNFPKLVGVTIRFLNLSLIENDKLYTDKVI